MEDQFLKHLEALRGQIDNFRLTLADRNKAYKTLDAIAKQMEAFLYVPISKKRKQ